MLPCYSVWAGLLALPLITVCVGYNACRLAKTALKKAVNAACFAFLGANREPLLAALRLLTPCIATYPTRIFALRVG